MSVPIQIPDSLDDQRRRTFANLDEMAKEATLIELYRAQKLTHHELASALG